LRANRLIPQTLPDYWKKLSILLNGQLADARPEVAVELVSIQTLINLWLKTWAKPVNTESNGHCYLYRQNNGLAVPWIFLGS
jgi:hypothetical protein